MDYLSAADAAAYLGIRRATLYAYASRGLVTSVPGLGEARRERRYARADLERLKARHDARAGHGAVAAAALRWGEPVLESALTEIAVDGPRYRGRAARALAAAGVGFEAVAELLWGAPAARPTRWRFSDGGLGMAATRLAALLGRGAAPLTALALALPSLAAHDPARFDAPPDAERERARRLLPRLAACLGLARGAAPARRALDADTVAGAFLRSLGGKPTPAAVSAVDAALVLCADHELNPSTFAARIAASAGADLYACLGAALATLSGPRHGGACDRTEALLIEIGRPARTAAVVRERARRGEVLPGFGHPLYPGGDPRAPPLLRAAARLAPRHPTVRTVRALCAAMADAGRAPPTVDLGLVALAAALGLPAGAAVSLFAVGRAAGWVAHVLEQRAAGYVLRPRARYVGA
jgi:citrate synthase